MYVFVNVYIYTEYRKYIYILQVRYSNKNIYNHINVCMFAIVFFLP